MRKPIEERILTISEPTKDEIIFKYEQTLKDIRFVLSIDTYTETEKLYLIGYYTKIGLDKNVKFAKFNTIEMKEYEKRIDCV